VLEPIFLADFCLALFFVSDIDAFSVDEIQADIDIDAL